MHSDAGGVDVHRAAPPDKVGAKICALPSDGSSFLEAALAYASRGWLVFPCVPHGKPPAVRGGFYAATTNPAAIRRLWGARDYNIGIRCGAGSGLLVLDDDGGEIDGLPPTPTVETSRGVQYYFQHVPGIRCSAGKLGPHLDIRSDGGYVIAPPSVHPSGKVYRWLVTGDPIAAPDWLIERLRAAARPSNSERAIAAAGLPPSGGRPGGGSGYGRKALASEAEALGKAGKGGRNAALNRAAFCLFQLVAGGELAEGEVVAALVAACERNGLVAEDGLRQVHRTIRSGATAGLQHPRRRAA
jgi:hypothetical protein